ncbi:MAG TPA: methyltransferase, partial [Polyangiaceae bacterium]
MSFAGSIMSALRRTADGAAVLAGPRVISGNELAARSFQLARALRAGGVGPDVVAVWPGGDAELLAGRIAVHLLGGTFVCAAHRALINELNNKPSLVVDADWLTEASNQPPDAVAGCDADDLGGRVASIRLRRGTRLDIQTYWALGERLRALSQVLGPDASRHTVLLPLDDLGGELALATLLGGGTVVCADAREHPARILAGFERTRSTHVSIASELLWQLSCEPSASLTDLSTLRRVLHVGPKARRSDLDRAFNALGLVLWHLDDPHDDPTSACSTAEDLKAAAATAAQEQVRHIRAEHVRTLVADLEQAVLFSMLYSLQRCGMLRERTRDHSATEIVEAARVAPQHRTLIERWLHELVKHRLVAHVRGRYCGTNLVVGEELHQAWDRATQTWTAGLGSVEFMRYLRANAAQLPELMTGEQRAVSLLFPEGRTELAETLYRDTSIARYLNAAVAAAVRSVASATASHRALRVLEVGAGTGATTQEVVAALSREPRPHADVDYLFTDTSSFFLEAARKRFAPCPWVRFGLFDIDRAPRTQGLAPGGFDVVVAAGVLNNARDV